jgi:hypothetical protein
MNLINLLGRPYGQFSPRLKKFVRQERSKNIKERGQSNQNIKESLDELQEKFFNFIKVKFGAVARDDDPI